MSSWIEEGGERKLRLTYSDGSVRVVSKPPFPGDPAIRAGSVSELMNEGNAAPVPASRGVPWTDLQPGMCTIETTIAGRRTGRHCGVSEGTRLYDVICANEHMPDEPRWLCPLHARLVAQLECSACLDAQVRGVRVQLIDVAAADAAPEAPRSVQRRRERKASPDDDESWFRG
jgi:hypothetical protein